jgi:hypothetical protein
MYEPADNLATPLAAATLLLRGIAGYRAGRLAYRPMRHPERRGNRGLRPALRSF